jgi:hypothetical protein
MVAPEIGKTGGCCFHCLRPRINFDFSREDM